MDDPDLTEKNPRDFDSEDSTSAVDDVPIHVAPPARAAEIPPLPPLRAARGTRTGMKVPVVQRGSRRATLPPPIPAAARSNTGITIPAAPRSNGAFPRATTNTGVAVPPAPLFTTTSGPSKLVPFLPPDEPAEAPANVIVAPQPPPLPVRAAATIPPPLPALPPLPPLPLPELPKPAPSWFDQEPHVAAPPIPASNDDEDDYEDDLESQRSIETEYFDRTSGPPKERNVAAITGIAVGSLFVITLLTLGLRGHGSHTEAATTAPSAARFEPPPPPPQTQPAAKLAVTKPAPLPEAAKPAVPAPAPVQVAAPAPTPAEVAAPDEVATPDEVAAPAPTQVAAVAPAPVRAAAPVAAPARVAAPAPVIVAEAAPAAPPSFAELPVTSQPTGATVTLIANGDATIVGRTPVTAKVDPTHDYDIVIALRNMPTRVVHVDPRTTHVLAVDLGSNAPAEEPAPAPAPEKRRTAPRPVAKPKTVAIAAPAPKPAPVAKPAPAPAAVVPAGSGILMVSAKPPCNIAIDGKMTGLVTPQRSIALAPGVHAITLTNSGQKIVKTVSVKIVAKQPTKLIQDFTKN